MKRQFTLLAGILSVVFFTQMNAAIISTDMPDLTLKKDPTAEEEAKLAIDIDNDGSSDFIFETHFIAKMVYNGADVITVSEDEWDVIRGLELNTSINANAGFYAGVDAYLNAGWGTYVFPSNQDKYLGVRFTKNTKTYYGWIKIELTDDGIVFKEYAYESIANKAIKAGEKENVATSINESLNIPSLKMYPNPTSELLHIESSDIITTISIMDIAGFVVKKIDPLTGYVITITVEDLSSGVYYISIHSGSKTNSYKFYKN